MTEHENPPSSDQPPTPGDNPEPTPPACPDTPLEFLDPVADWALQFSKWARDVDRCYEYECMTSARTDRLHSLCDVFFQFAVELKVWADAIESCYQHDCDVPRITSNNHPPPPNPPFEIRLPTVPEEPTPP